MGPRNSWIAAHNVRASRLASCAEPPQHSAWNSEIHSQGFDSGPPRLVSRTAAGGGEVLVGGSSVAKRPSWMAASAAWFLPKAMTAASTSGGIAKTVTRHLL